MARFPALVASVAVPACSRAAPPRTARRAGTHRSEPGHAVRRPVSPAGRHSVRRRPRPPAGRPGRPPADPDDVRAATAMATVRHLAGRVGPRPGTSPAYFRAADLGRAPARGVRLAGAAAVVPDAGGRLLGRPGAGRAVGQPGRHPRRRPPGPAVAGWSAPTSTRCRRRPARRTTPPASACCSRWPRRCARPATRLPVVLVAFGSEEPRGRATTTTTSAPARTSPGSRRPSAALRGMVSLDRVGVGAGGPGEQRATARTAMRAAAARRGTAGRRARPAR